MGAMKLQKAARLVLMVLSLGAAVTEARHGHLHELRHAHHKHLHISRAETGGALVKRGQCAFPTGAGLVAVTPGSQNGGWAMSPDQPCLPGHYCPYACPPGQLMAQWDPSSTTYSYPGSMNGGLFCDSNGQISKPFPDKPYCVQGTGSIGCKNEAGGSVAFCQTVLPGNEAMLIPTVVDSSRGLAVPDTSYWASTAAHYYINPPGVSAEKACIWGSSSNPVGNWSPYVAGANTDGSGNTFVKIGWNPIYLEPATPFKDVMPDWGVRIDCEGGGCNGLPCAIDPKQHKVNQCSSSGSFNGAGGANSCVVTVPKGSKANIVVFGGSGGGGGGSAPASSPPPSPPSSSAPPPPPKTTSPPPPPPPKTTSAPPPPPSTTSTSSSSIFTPPAVVNVTVVATPTESSTSTTASTIPVTYAPHVFVENATSTYVAPTLPPTQVTTKAATHTAGAPRAVSVSALGVVLAVACVIL